MTGHRSRAAPPPPCSRASDWPQKHSGGREEKRKGAARLMARFDPIPASPKWMIADYLWLSVQVRNNCSFCEYLTGDICFNCSFGTNLQPPLTETIVFFFFFFFCLHEGRCNYFCNVCSGFSVWLQHRNPYTALFSLPTPEPAKNVNVILLW